MSKQVWYLAWHGSFEPPKTVAFSVNSDDVHFRLTGELISNEGHNIGAYEMVERSRRPQELTGYTHMALVTLNHIYPLETGEKILADASQVPAPAQAMVQR